MNDDRVYLQHIRDAIDDIVAYAAAGRSTFDAERMRQDAIVRKLEVIGEAVKQLSDATGDVRARASFPCVAGRSGKPDTGSPGTRRGPLGDSRDIRRGRAHPRCPV
ncbi:MAG: DUF86 domain-containing protein [Acidobacteria bacterium]|nr:DUF86 domain-containing protein [Acidobacteriota bacterium]MBI3265258.1 DUF86 domain-containing protein [Acidobacteriota bacterium]